MREVSTVQTKSENPAKAFLKRYRAMMQRRESLQRAIDEAYDRATSCTQRLKAVQVTSSGTGDRLAEDVIKIADSTEQLKEVIQGIDRELQDILRAIDSVGDEMQKTVLTLRYIEGLDWLKISECTGYETANVYKLHGRGLWHVEKYLLSKSA